MRVELSGSAGFTFAENSLNGECIAEFMDVPAGNYRVKVTGANVASLGESDVEIGPVVTQEVEVQARHTSNSNAGSSSPFVSVHDLGVPSKAEKEFEKANQLIARQEWPKAIERLHKAIAIYPNYASAYNNLGAVYSRVGNADEARNALQKAIALNDHMGPAYVNMARLSFEAKDYAAAESFINKALSLAAPDTEELTLLAFAELSDRHLDQAIETSHRAHTSQLAHHAYLHLVAARADEMENKISDSMAELRQYLNEDPAGPRAQDVRTALATFQNSTDRAAKSHASANKEQAQ
jgi:Flp pilus assembly protein TadD